MLKESPPELLIKTKPYKHQSLENSHYKDHARALFWEMGAGKSKPILDMAVRLYSEIEIDGLLIISDNGAYRNWVDYEIPIHMHENVPKRIACWASAMNRKQEHVCNQLLVANDETLDILVMPVEAFAHERAPVFAEAFLRSHYVLMVIDESTSIANLKAKRTEAIIGLGRLAEYRRILSGTPVTNNPLSLFSQFEFLGPKMLGHSSFTAFRSEYCKLMLMNAPGGRGKYFQILGYQNLEQLSRKIAPISSRVLKTECLDLPEKIYTVRSVDLTPEQMEVYDDILNTAVHELEVGMVTTTNALATLTKLHQVACGHIKDDEGVIHRLPSNRVSELVRITEEVQRKIIIWAFHREDIKMIYEALTEKYGQLSAVHYYGETDEEERILAIRRFRDNPECKFFVASQSTGGKGITLVESHDVIYYSQSFSLMHRLQSEDRCHRPGQRENVTYVDLIAKGTIDIKVVKALKAKKDLASQVLDVYRQLLQSDAIPFDWPTLNSDYPSVSDSPPTID